MSIKHVLFIFIKKETDQHKTIIHKIILKNDGVCNIYSKIMFIDHLKNTVSEDLRVWSTDWFHYKKYFKHTHVVMGISPWKPKTINVKLLVELWPMKLGFRLNYDY
jgi:hypothetical protein